LKAAMIAKALGGRKVGGGWMARCPAHHDRDPSRKVLVRCHAGCTQKRVITVLQSRGLWPQSDNPRVAFEDRPGRAANRIEAAMAIWQSATPAARTLVETYLVSGGLHVPPPLTLRYHAGLRHLLAASGRRWWRW
jgi:putative DNA primase/helicase